jgi:NitT/TauT family transport system permease protein
VAFRGRISLIHVAIIFSFFALWELVTRLSLISPLVLTPLEKIVAFGMANYGAVLANLPPTFFEIAVAIAIVVPSGIILGVLIGYLYIPNRVVTPVLLAAYAIPAFILYPLYIVWFGLGSGSKIALACTLGFFPIVLNTIAGMNSINRRYYLFARSIGLSSSSMIRKLLIPLALPSILTGLKIGIALVEIGVVGSEMLGGFSGLGLLIAEYQGLLYISGVYFVTAVVAAIIVLTVVALQYLVYVTRRFAY